MTRKEGNKWRNREMREREDKLQGKQRKSKKGGYKTQMC